MSSAARRDQVSKSTLTSDYACSPVFPSGECFYCVRGHTGRCDKSKLIGSPLLDGAQAEYVRIAMGESTLFQAPTTIPKEILILMADIFPTGYFVAKKARDHLEQAEGAGHKEETTCVVIGCGPVGLCAITSATEFFTHVYAIDSVPARLELAKKHGATKTFNFQDKSVDYLAEIKSLTAGRGADVALEVVGHPSALQTAVEVVRPHGVISSCGVHTHPLSLQGPDCYNKNLKFDFGRCPVRALFGDALKMLEKKQDSFKGFVENVVPMEECQEWYQKFEVSKEQRQEETGVLAYWLLTATSDNVCSRLAFATVCRKTKCRRLPSG